MAASKKNDSSTKRRVRAVTEVIKPIKKKSTTSKKKQPTKKKKSTNKKKSTLINKPAVAKPLPGLDTPATRLTALRNLMKKNGLTAYYIPSTDPHQDEYVPACWQRRKWVSGFTGSAGDLVVTNKEALLWTDGRYFLQAALELQGSSIKLMKDGEKDVPTINAWLTTNLNKGDTFGADPQVLSRGVENELRAAVESAGAKFKLIEPNLVDALWADRPEPPKVPIEIWPLKYAGQSAKEKLAKLREILAERKADALVVTTLDAVAWLFNIRAWDIDHHPFVIANAILTPQKAQLFVDTDKISASLRRELGRLVDIIPYEHFSSYLASLGKSKKRIWVEGRSASSWVMNKLKGSATLILEANPINRLKAQKNAAEIAGMKQAHLADGVAMVKFLYWLDRAVVVGGESEISLAHKLAELRAAHELFRGDSFGTIVGYGPNGAIIHYTADEHSNAPLLPEGILLVDSGGQYLCGTTDITRTLCLGNTATAAQRDHYTRVLKGHIALARCRFPSGFAGRALDVLARQFLWERGLNYNHGTGHGIGAYLGVHEGPQSIHQKRCQGVPLEEGNMLSNEPGHYQEGAYGIRLENIVLVVKDQEFSTPTSTWLQFETITLCPFDRKLIEPSLLTSAERTWINDYHQRVRETLCSLLEPHEAAWLVEATRVI